MKKVIKIFFKFLAIFILCILAILIIIPTFFKETIKEKVVAEVNKTIDATLEFDDFSLSLIRNFPNLSFRLEGVNIGGKDKFEGETLVGFKSFGFIFDLGSLLGKEGYIVKSVVLDRPVANAIVLEDGTANWDIVLLSEAENIKVEEVPAEEPDDKDRIKKPKEVRVQLKEILIKSASINYSDYGSGIRSEIGSLDMSLKGDLSESQTNLVLSLSIGGINLDMDGERYLNNLSVNGKFDIEADIENKVYKINNNSISLNDLTLNMDGQISMNESDIIPELILSTDKTEFKSILSMVPAFFMTDYKDLNSEGSVKLDAVVSGVYSQIDSLLPDFGVNIAIDGASAWYNGSPQMISNLTMETSVGVESGYIKGSVALNIDELNLTEIMAIMPQDTIPDSEDDTASVKLDLIEIPDNIDFDFSAEIGKLMFDPIEAEEIKTHITVRDGLMTIDDTGMDILDGQVSFSAIYDTRDIEEPRLESNVAAEGIGIKKSYETFNTFQKLAPVAEGMDGTASVRFEFKSLLRSDMMPVLNSINGLGRFESEEIELVNSSIFNKFSTVLNLGDKFSNTFNDVEVEFRIENGRVYIKPFDTNMGVMKMKISGDHGLDQTINYLIASAIPASDLPSALNTLVRGLKAQAAMFGLDYSPPEVYNVNIGITGTVSDPEFKPTIGNSGNSAGSTVKAAAKEIVEKKVEEIKSVVSDEIDKQAENILKEAERQAENIKAEAKKAAQTVRDEAALSAQKLIDEAESKGALAKIAAKKGADVIIKEADKKADKIEEEAAKRADKIVGDARSKIGG